MASLSQWQRSWQRSLDLLSFLPSLDLAALDVLLGACSSVSWQQALQLLATGADAGCLLHVISACEENHLLVQSDALWLRLEEEVGRSLGSTSRTVNERGVRRGSAHGLVVETSWLCSRGSSLQSLLERKMLRLDMLDTCQHIWSVLKGKTSIWKPTGLGIRCCNFMCFRLMTTGKRA